MTREEHAAQRALVDRHDVYALRPHEHVHTKLTPESYARPAEGTRA